MNFTEYEKHSRTYLGPFLWSKLKKKERGMNSSLNAFTLWMRKRDLPDVNEEWVQVVRAAISKIVNFNFNILYILIIIIIII